VIIEGVAHESTVATLCSTVHGAGRVMGRMEAKGKTDRKTGEVKRAGKVTPEMMREWVSREQVELRGAGVDESPHCYERLPEVLAEHRESIRILHTLRPWGVAMWEKEKWILCGYRKFHLRFFFGGKMRGEVDALKKRRQLPADSIARHNAITGSAVVRIHEFRWRL
jgi:hypothetical protein